MRRRIRRATTRRRMRDWSPGATSLLATWMALPGADWAQVSRASDLPNAVSRLPRFDAALAHNLPLDTAAVSNGDEIRVALWRGGGRAAGLSYPTTPGRGGLLLSRLLQHGKVGSTGARSASRPTRRAARRRCASAVGQYWRAIASRRCRC
ncbi:MAG: hypothetical protein U0703_19380 [Anaerolineae bacterium]